MPLANRTKMKKQRMYFNVIIKERLLEIKEGLNLYIEREHYIPGGNITENNQHQDKVLVFKYKDSFRQANKNIKGDPMLVYMFSRNNYLVFPLSLSKVS